MFSETEVWISPMVTTLSIFFFSAEAFGSILERLFDFPSLFSTNLYSVGINFFEKNYKLNLKKIRIIAINENYIFSRAVI